MSLFNNNSAQLLAQQEKNKETNRYQTRQSSNSQTINNQGQNNNIFGGQNGGNLFGNQNQGSNNNIFQNKSQSGQNVFQSSSQGSGNIFQTSGQGSMGNLLNNQVSTQKNNQRSHLDYVKEQEIIKMLHSMAEFQNSKHISGLSIILEMTMARTTRLLERVQKESENIKKEDTKKAENDRNNIR